MLLIAKGFRPDGILANDKAEIKIVGCDLHANQQTIAMVPSPAASNLAPHAALAYSTARQVMGTHAIAGPHPAAPPFAAILRETVICLRETTLTVRALAEQTESGDCARKLPGQKSRRTLG